MTSCVVCLDVENGADPCRCACHAPGLLELARVNFISRSRLNPLQREFMLGELAKTLRDR